jgi:hypothetical protein
MHTITAVIQRVQINIGRFFAPTLTSPPPEYRHIGTYSSDNPPDG